MTIPDDLTRRAQFPSNPRDPRDLPNGHAYEPVPIREHDAVVREARLSTKRAVLEALLGSGSMEVQAARLVEVLGEGMLADAVRANLNDRHGELVERRKARDAEAAGLMRRMGGAND